LHLLHSFVVRVGLWVVELPGAVAAKSAAKLALVVP